MAANINLKSGETITIQSNQNSSISCENASSVNCATAVRHFKSRLDLCLSTNTTEHCINTIWPEYKKNNPLCLDEASDYCLTKCAENSETNWCLNSCK